MKSYYTTDDLNDVLEQMHEEKIKSKKLQEESTHKLFVNDSHEKKAKRLRTLAIFIETEQVVTWYNTGCLLINNKFIFSTKTNKWRIRGVASWTDSKGPEDFIENVLEHDGTYFVGYPNDGIKGRQRFRKSLRGIA
jgi:hypothetical protein